MKHQIKLNVVMKLSRVHRSWIMYMCYGMPYLTICNENIFCINL